MPETPVVPRLPPYRLVFDGAKLAAARKSSGMKRAALAAVTGRTSEMIRRYEANLNDPPLTMAHELLAAINAARLSGGKAPLELGDLMRREARS